MRQTHQGGDGSLTVADSGAFPQLFDPESSTLTRQGNSCQKFTIWGKGSANPDIVWFRRKAKLDLLNRLLELETRRIDHREVVESKRDEIELRKLEIEMAHLDARTKATIELDKAKAELREKRRAIGRRAALKRWGRDGDPQAPTCRLCINPMVRNPTVAEIRAHQLHESGEAAPPASDPGPEKPPELGN